MVPDDLRDLLEPYVAVQDWDQVNLQFRNLDFLDRVTAREQVIPAARWPRPLVFVTRKVARALRTMGATIGYDVYLDPSAEGLDDAASIALAGHEMVHVAQGEQVPDFLDRYGEAQEGVPDSRPWENPFEMEAYLVECRLYQDMIDLGYPPGDWTPLGVARGFCKEFSRDVALASAMAA